MPYREEKAERPVRRGIAFVALRSDGAVMLRERPLKGLLGGMLETPSSPWTDAEPKTIGEHAPIDAEWRKVPGMVEHTFTHFHLELTVYRAEVEREAVLKRAAEPERCNWLKLGELAGAALPSVMRKVIAHALKVELRPVRAKPEARVDAAPPRARRRSA